MAKPYLLPKYDSPEFVVRGIWHLYAGWFDGNPAHLKPAPAAELAVEPPPWPEGRRKLARRAELLGGPAGKPDWPPTSSSSPPPPRQMTRQSRPRAPTSMNDAWNSRLH